MITAEESGVSLSHDAGDEMQFKNDPDRLAIIAGAERLGLSRAQIAEAAGLSTATVYEFLNGNSDPRGTARQKMLAAAGVKIVYRLPRNRSRSPRGPGRPRSDT